MSEIARDNDSCRRCGHSTRHSTGSVAHLARKAIGRKEPRVQCGQPTDHGWPCPCRSRFHVS